MSSVMLLCAICVLLFLSGFFSGSEIALVSADRLRMQSESEEGGRGAAIALRMLAQPTRTLSTCLVGTNLCAIGMATMGTQLVLRHTDVPPSLAFLFVVPVTLTLAELVPKALYQYHADTVVPVLVFPLKFCGFIFAPILWVLEGIARFTGGDGPEEQRMSRAGIRMVFDTAKNPNLTPEDKALIRRVFAFTEAIVEEAMVPLIHVSAVPDTMSCVDAAVKMIKSGHSRLPIYHERIDDITGILHYQDLLTTQDWTLAVADIARTPLFIPETKRVDHLLQDFRRVRQRMAVAVDEYGGAVGIITVEDLLEEIVGEIEDESDRTRTQVRRVAERRWVANGRAEREHLETACGLQLPDGDFETIAGFILTSLGRIPRVGEILTREPYSITVSKVSDRAILEVQIHRTRR